MSMRSLLLGFGFGLLDNLGKSLLNVLIVKIVELVLLEKTGPFSNDLISSVLGGPLELLLLFAEVEEVMIDERVRVGRFFLLKEVVIDERVRLDRLMYQLRLRLTLTSRGVVEI